MSEKSARKALDDARKATTARNHAASRPLMRSSLAIPWQSGTIRANPSGIRGSYL